LQLNGRNREHGGTCGVGRFAPCLDKSSHKGMRSFQTTCSWMDLPHHRYSALVEVMASVMEARHADVSVRNDTDGLVEISF